MRPVHFCLVIFSSALVSCVSTGQYKAMQLQAQKNDSPYIWSMRTLKSCQDANNDLIKQKESLQDKANDMNLISLRTSQKLYWAGWQGY